MRILIVDDDPAMAELLASVCEADGHEVQARGSSREAVDHLAAHEVDLLITDIAMAPPDGLQLVRTARIMQPDLMAIAVTGYWGRYTLAEVLATGALDLMFKPFRVEEMRARLAMAAERRRMAIEEKGRAQRIATSIERVRVLLVEDDPEAARAVQEVLSNPREGLFEIHHAADLAAALQQVEHERADVVLLSLSLGGGSGVEAVERVRAAAPSLPVVALTARASDRALAARVLQAGAQDFVPKGEVDEPSLPRVIRHAIERQRLLADSESVRRQQQRLREELVLHELQLKDEFMSHVSHELRSPLTAIHQFSTILMDEIAGPLNGDQRDALRVVLRNIGQLESMIDDLLEITRMQNGKLSIELQSVLAAEVVADAIDTLRGLALGKNITLGSTFAPDLPTAYADPVRTRQVLNNLIGNAVKFTPEGGFVTVSVARDADPAFLRFEVRDTGCGLSPESADRIFERLYQVRDSSKASRKGLGLGLFICKELVTQQEGRIWVESEPGKGSSFCFTLPVFGNHTPLRTKEITVKRDLLARVDGPFGPITSVPPGGVNG